MEWSRVNRGGHEIVDIRRKEWGYVYVSWNGESHGIYFVGQDGKHLNEHFDLVEVKSVPQRTRRITLE